MVKNSNQKTDSAPEVLNNNPINEATNASISPYPKSPVFAQIDSNDKVEIIIKNQIKILNKLDKLEEAFIPKEYVNDTIAASMLSIYKRQLYNMKVKGIIGHSKVNGKSFFKISDINSILSANYTKSFKK